jgi:hypothetical protein
MQNATNSELTTLSDWWGLAFDSLTRVKPAAAAAAAAMPFFVSQAPRTHTNAHKHAHSFQAIQN